MSSRRFLVSCYLLTTLLLVGISSVNYSIDVNRVYHAGNSDEHARIVDFVQALRDSALGMVEPPWDRALKWELARASDAECFVTGSSRAMLFGKSQLHILGSDCRSAVNLAVNGAGFEDFVTVAGIIQEKRFLKAVYVGIDPWGLALRVRRTMDPIRGRLYRGQAKAGFAGPRRRTELAAARQLGEWTVLLPEY